MLRRLRRRYWAWHADLLTQRGTPNLPRLYEQYGRAALAGAAADPVMAQKINRRVGEMLHKRDKDGRPVRGRALYAYLTGTALGAAQLIFSTPAPAPSMPTARTCLRCTWRTPPATTRSAR